MFKEIRKKMIYISCIISLMIMCHSVVYATAPTKNPSTSGSQNSGRTLSPSNGAYSATGSPSTGILGNSSSSTDHTPDEIITEANEFVSQGTNSPMDGEKLKGASSTLYNLLLSIGIFLSVAIGVYLGVKFMLSTAEDKAKVKEALIPYIVGCVVIFSAFIIWKAIIELLGGIS